MKQEIHQEHILKSQEILENFFERPIEIFVPAGSVWSFKTYEVLKKTNIKKVIANQYMLDSKEKMGEIEFQNSQKGFFNFHDRDLKLFGKKWLIEKIEDFEKA